MILKPLYSASILDFVQTDNGELSTHFQDSRQWQDQIELLKAQFNQLPHLAGDVVLGLSAEQGEFSVEVVILYRGLVFVIAIGFDEQTYTEAKQARLHQQARTLKQQHRASADKFIIPVAIETKAEPQGGAIHVSEDLVANTMCDNGQHLAALIEHFSNQYKDDQIILSDWLASAP